MTPTIKGDIKFLTDQCKHPDFEWSQVAAETIRYLLAQASENATLRARAEAAEKDSERINRLEAHLKHNRIWKDTVLMHDYEDGVWLAHAPRGTLLGCLPLEHKSPHKGLREAIDAALPSPVPESGKGEGL